MYKIKHTHTNEQTLTETHQKNPLRWKMLYREDESSFSDQAPWMKCKDYFNDIVAVKHGLKFTVHGFNNSHIKLNDEGMYVLLKAVANKDQFIENLKIINERMLNDLDCVVEFLDAGYDQLYIILLPTKLLEKTYYVSLATLCIRYANYGVTFKDWKDMFENTMLQQCDTGLNIDCVRKYVKKNGFTLPESQRQYWWRFNSQLYNDSPGLDSFGHWQHYMHSAGVNAWGALISMEPVPA